MKLESALSRVVLPEPVPPLIRMLRRSPTAASSRSRCAGLSVPSSTSSAGPGAAGAEAADRERRPVDRERRDHDVDPRAVGETGVDHRAELVDAAAERREDALDRVAQRLLVVEATAGRLDPARPLDVDAIGAVDHHLLDPRVVEQLLERPEADRVADDPRRERLAVGLAEQRRLLGDQGSRPRSASVARRRSDPRPRRRARRSISRCAQDGGQLLDVALPRVHLTSAAAG